MKLPASHPIVSCAEAQALEARVLGGDEAAEWAAMQRAGAAVADALRADGREAGEWAETGRMLVLAGKGHNAGDALIAARRWREFFPRWEVEVCFVFGERALRPFAARAWRDLVQRGEVRTRTVEELAGAYDVAIDGVFGFQFRPPAEETIRALLARANALDVRVRAAVDLPSAGIFRADFTYATGSVKTPVVDAEEAGRVRYLDLGFLANDVARDEGDRVLRRDGLAPLGRLRPARCDKRSYGHLFVVSGSRSYPGAVLMNVLAALHSGVGLVTAFVPETLAPALAARAPEAIWVGCPETSDGGLGLDALHLVRERWPRATALLTGSGLAREPETLALITEVVKLGRVPTVLDGDALQPEIVRATAGTKVLTPHAGEFARVAGESADVRTYARAAAATVVLKGTITRVSAGGAVYHSFFGGPVLARGGSGDVLAGLVGGLLAQEPDEPLLAASRAVLWHGLAADALARARGPVAVATTDLLTHLSEILRDNA